MSKQTKAWARKAREKLMDELGRVCVWCRATEATGVKLTFDCIVPKGHDHHRRMDTSARMCFYRREHAADNLQVLCESCNGKKGDDVIRFIPARLSFAHMGELAPF